MNILLTPEKWTLDLYPEITEKNVDKKLSNYVVTAQTYSEIVLLHTITWAIYSFEKEEYNDILNNETLFENKVVIPSDFDESDIANKVYLRRMTKPTLPDYKYIDGYVVFTTNSCNARCFYCYEENLSKTETMSKETAENLVQFMIKKRSGTAPLSIQWFGGEPLLNQRVIDYIVDRLSELNIPFTSSIITNAFLLNEETIAKFERWNLKNIQITLDGINDDYNKAKNYVYSDVDAYLVVINNIRNVLEKTDVMLSIRINANVDNINNLYSDIELLKDEFSEYLNKKLSMYVAPLFGYVDDSYEVTNDFWEKLESLQKIVTVNPLNCCDSSLNEGIFNRKKINGACMAYNNRWVVVTPKGLLGPCEHIRDEDIFGDIFSGVTNTEVIKKWQNFDGEEIKYCKDTKCPYHPLCPKLYQCGTSLICSIPEQQKMRLNKASIKLLRTKLYYDKKIEEMNENIDDK